MTGDNNTGQKYVGPIERLFRKSVLLYRNKGGWARVVAYQMRFVRAKLPLLVHAAVAKITSRRLLKSIVAQNDAVPGTPVFCIRSKGAGLGDEVVIARFLRDFAAECGPICFDIATVDSQRSGWVFSAVPGFRNCVSTFAYPGIANAYHCVLDIDHVVHIAGRSTKSFGSERLAGALDRISAFNRAKQKNIANMPYDSAALAREAVYSNHRRADFLHAQAGIPYGGDPYLLAGDITTLDQFGLHGREFVTIHNGFDPAFIISGARATKCYPHFDEVIAHLRRVRPDTFVVQLGTSTSQRIDGVDMDLVGKTTLKQVAGLLAAARLHVDIDSGLVHVAASAGTKACVVFGPTDADYFAYSGHVAIRPTFCGGCWWINDAWMDQCPRGFADARCMTSQSSTAIAAMCVTALSSPPS